MCAVAVRMRRHREGRGVETGDLAAEHVEALELASEVRGPKPARRTSTADRDGVGSCVCGPRRWTPARQGKIRYDLRDSRGRGHRDERVAGRPPDRRVHVERLRGIEMLEPGIADAEHSAAMLGTGRRPTNHPRGVAGQRARDWSCANRVFATQGRLDEPRVRRPHSRTRRCSYPPPRSWGIAHRNCRRDRVSGGIDAGEGAVERINNPQRPRRSRSAQRHRPGRQLPRCSRWVDPKGTVRERRGHPERSEAHRHTARRCGRGSRRRGTPLRSSSATTASRCESATQTAPAPPSRSIGRPPTRTVWTTRPAFGSILETVPS